MDAKENMLRAAVRVRLTLPNGHETSVTEDGSKALMDLLVELCSRYHLNPALHTLELLSPEGHSLGFKPNALLGSLNVACVLIKEKVWEEKVRRPAPKVPEKTVRLMVNYHGSQKAVVRVNPLVPLQALVPVICEKCDFDPAHVLLLKDSISRHELPLNKSLTEVGIKELYVHDQSLVLQPKMASAPVLNYSDSIRSSTTSLGKDKKGLLGIFQFSKRKNKTETSSMDMDDYDDQISQNTDSQSNGLSTVSGLEDRPSTLGQSQSVMNMLRTSPKAETKKRRAPALPGAQTSTLGHASFESYQMSLGSESQQRKRKAPAPPPTPASITPSPEDTSPSAAPTPDSPATEIPTPVVHRKVVQSTEISAVTVVTQTVKPAPLKMTELPPAVRTVTPTPSSPTPSSSTTDSQAIHDSSSELSHSLDDSDADLDQTGSLSTLTSSTASGSVQVQTTTISISSRVEESEMSSSVAGKLDEDTSSVSSSRSDTESALNLKLDEVENQRHSGMGSLGGPVPPKPRRRPSLESPQLVLPPSPSPSPNEPTEIDSPESPLEEAAPQSWLHSMHSTQASSQKAEPDTPEEETMSLGSSSSSSSGSSLPDQGYAASEGMAECEDSGLVSSPSDTQPTSPDGSLCLDGSSAVREERLLGPVRDNSSDSDEGCATWGSRRRHNETNKKTKTGKIKESYDGEAMIRAELDRTLADLEADLSAHMDVSSVKKTSYTISTDSNEVPVSVVDMDVPVTAIDEVLEDFECNNKDKGAKSLTRMDYSESTGSKGPGFCHQLSVESQNKNNNACTAAEINKSISLDSKQTTQTKKKNKSAKAEKSSETKFKETSITDTIKVKEDKQRTTSAVKSSVDTLKPIKETEIKNDPVKSKAQSFNKNKPVLPPSTQRSTDKDEEVQIVYQNNLSTNTSLSKITRSVTSRFGMNTFTVVPPKPPVIHDAGDPAATLTVGAIKIDDQGNMVNPGTIYRSKFGGSSESGINSSERSPLLGKAKAFWSSNERQESAVPTNKGLIDIAKEGSDGLKSSATNSASAVKINIIEDQKTIQTYLSKPSERPQPKEIIKEELKEPVKEVKVVKEEQIETESKTSVSKDQQPTIKPALSSPVIPNLTKDLSFLKTSRRTSSQYVASAINRYTPKTPVKPSFTPSIPESSAPMKTQTLGSQRSGRSILINPQLSPSSASFENNENESSFKFPGPKRSISYPEYMSDSQTDFGEVKADRGGFGSSVGSTKGISITLERETTKSMLFQSSGPAQVNVMASIGRDEIKHVRPRSLSPAQRSPVRSSAKPPTAPKTVPQVQTYSSREVTVTINHLTPDVKPQPPETVTDSAVAPGPPPLTLFGPVKKFKPVICKSVEKETSLHSSLMEAIQTGGGRERLKKISSSSSSTMKKASYVEEENERSALLAAIRATNSSGRLRKTKSEAADELEKFRKASEDERSAGPPSSSFSSSQFSLTCTSPPPVFTPPPSPAMLAPPPPPPALVLRQSTPSTGTHPGADAVAREAMLEAIRSGSAAGRLKKVAVPTKTVKVNGRLGTIQAASSTLPQP